ncbi:MAG: bifunctional phosphopantothenoylcysteine decarboxylase/phosphopantothenate--cysteine ligase CoaBC [Candidatus Abyssubacteria bacterium]
MKNNQALLKNSNIVLGVCGGIAAYKACDLASRLRQAGAEVRTVMTAAAQRFVSPLTFQSLTRQAVVTDLFTPIDVWEIEHISLAQKASLVVIAPATANIIGKLSCGIADDFLSTFVLATHAPILLCPAMNCEMYENQVVQQNLERLKARGFHVVEPEQGLLACGDIGKGRLAAVDTIFERIVSLLARRQDFAGIKTLVTAGPTHEPIDPVRYITNPSTGKMGFALAQAAKERGAEVILVTGPVNLTPPAGVETFHVKTADEMARAVLERAQECKVIIGCAAVSDYTPEETAEHKIKKGKAEVTLRLKSTVDIMAELGKRKNDKILVGFSVETRDLVENSLKKLEAKNLDMIVCNDVTRPGAGFATDTNIVTILDRRGSSEQLPQMSKLDTAHTILDKVRELL